MLISWILGYPDRSFDELTAAVRSAETLGHPFTLAQTYLRGDSALYEHDLTGWLDERAIGYAISADMSPQLSQCIVALPENHWKLDRDETDAIREWPRSIICPATASGKKDAVLAAPLSRHPRPPAPW